MEIALGVRDMVVQIVMLTMVMEKTEPTTGMVSEEGAMIGTQVEGLHEMIGAIGTDQFHTTGLAGEGTRPPLSAISQFVG